MPKENNKKLGIKKVGSNRPRFIIILFKLVVSTLILAVLCVVAGVAYTWYMGQQNVPDSAAAIAPPSNEPAPISRAPIKPAENAKVGASIQTFTTPVKPGSNASIDVKTNPDANCVITAVYNDVPSKDSGLSPKIADEYGVVSWSWTVEASAPLGKWPVTVTCSHGKNSGMVRGDLVIVSQVD